MHTEISKTYRWGFTLIEQDLRRTIQVVADSLGKVSDAISPAFSAKVRLKDGSVVDITQVEDIFALENSGEKSIHAVSLHWQLCSKDNEPTHQVDVEFQNGGANEKNWNSITYRVSGPTRGWAFVTASEIDERIKRTKQLAWEGIFASKWIFSVTMMLATFTAFLLIAYLTPQEQYHVALERLYKAGELKDPIDALIRLEQLKSERNPYTAVYPILGTYGVIGGLGLLFGWLLPKISPGYNFCWGDYTQKYEKTKRLRTAFWTLVVLATIVSVAANFLSKKLGI